MVVTGLVAAEYEPVQARFAQFVRLAARFRRLTP